MCEFLSAVITNKGKKNEHVYYLNHHLIFETPRGETIRKRFGGDDIIGHSAIRAYFEIGEGTGTNFECSDFSTPSVFPDLLVQAIKNGEFRGIATPSGLLSVPAWKACDEATATARKACDEATATARKACDEATAPARKAYNEATATARKACDEATATAFWDLFAIPENRNPAWR